MSVSLACQCLSCPVHGESLGALPVCPFYPSSSITDAQWAVLEPLLPVGAENLSVLVRRHGGARGGYHRVDHCVGDEVIQSA